MLVMKTIRSIALLIALFGLNVVLDTFIPFFEGSGLLFAQDTKKNPENQKSEDRAQPEEHQSAACLSALQQARLVASILETYSRRLTSCAASLNLRDNCSTDFGGVRRAYSQYELAVSSVRNYCK